MTKQQDKDTLNHRDAQILVDDELCPVSIHIKTSAYPEEVLWRLESNGEIIDEVQQGAYYLANHLYTHEVSVYLKENS